MHPLPARSIARRKTIAQQNRKYSIKKSGLNGRFFVFYAYYVTHSTLLLADFYNLETKILSAL